MISYKVNYKGEDYELKQNLKTIFYYEAATDNVFEQPKNTYDLVLYMYSLFNGNGITVSLDELIEYIDENDGYINKFYSGIVLPEIKEEVKKKVTKKQVNPKE